MRKVDDGEKKRKEEEKKKRMTFLVATTSLPAVYRPNGYARTTTAGTPHARAKMPQSGVGSMQGKNTGNMPSAVCASSINKSLDPTPI